MGFNTGLMERIGRFKRLELGSEKKAQYTTAYTTVGVLADKAKRNSAASNDDANSFHDRLYSCPC